MDRRGGRRPWRDREAGCLWTGGVGGDHGEIERRVVYGQEGWEETMER